MTGLDTATDGTTEHSVDELFVRVAKIATLAGGNVLTNATGFFYLQDNYLYLITSRHVVIDEATNHKPDALELSLHTTNEDLHQERLLPIPLYAGGQPQWREHPSHGPAADVVAVPINDPHVLSGYFVSAFMPADIVGPETELPVGQDVLIVGFPLGFQDLHHNLPVVRKAMIANSFSHPFNGEPCFLTDARMHRGASGSPVVAQLADPAISEQAAPKWRLLGVHSAALDMSGRDPEQDEKLAINKAWYASLIPEMTPMSAGMNSAADRSTNGAPACDSTTG